MDRYSFITEDFHFIFLAGLSGAPRMSGLPQIETAEVQEDLTTAVAAIEEKTPPTALTAGTEAELPAEQRSVL
jgi:hypothetical protein